MTKEKRVYPCVLTYKTTSGRYSSALMWSAGRCICDRSTKSQFARKFAADHNFPYYEEE